MQDRTATSRHRRAEAIVRPLGDETTIEAHGERLMPCESLRGKATPVNRASGAAFLFKTYAPIKTKTAIGVAPLSSGTCLTFSTGWL